MRRREKHLYRDGAESAERREFERRYGKEHGDQVYGEVVGKVAREQAADRGGKKVERVRRSRRRSSKGKIYEVRQHQEVVVPEEEDRPRRSRGGDHDVVGHYSDGSWVRQHRSKNPRPH